MGETPFQPPSIELWPADLMHLIKSSPSKNPEDIESLVELWKMKQINVLCENSKLTQVRLLAQKIVEHFRQLNVLAEKVESLPKGNKLWSDFEQFCRNDAHDTNEEVTLEEKMLSYLQFLDS